MDIKLKEDVIFSTYNDERILKEKILEFIYQSKTDKILFKGNPKFMTYKLLKKILPLDKIKYDKSLNSINNFVEIESNNIREVYDELVEKVNCEYCLIYKV